MKHISLTTKPIVTNIEDVNRVSFHIFFPIKYNRKNLVNRILLKRLLTCGSKKYNTPNKYGEAYESNFIMNYEVRSASIYNYEYIEFYLCVPKEGLIEEYSLDNALDFFHEMIFNPDVDGNKFNEKNFKYEMDYLRQNESEFPEDITEFASEEYCHFIDPKEIDGISHDTYMKYLDEVTPEAVYEYYMNIIKNNDFFTFIGGAVGNDESVIDKYNKYFKQDYKELEYDLEYFNIHKVEKYQEKIIPKDYNQSMVFLHYNFKDYKEEEYLKLSLLDYILSFRENNLLFHKLRNEHNLIYTFHTSARRMRGYYDIILYIDKDNIEKAKELINEVFNDIRNKDLYEECKGRTLKAMEYDLLTLEDDSFSVLGNIISSYLDYECRLEEKIEKIKAISYEDMMNFLDRMVHTKTMIVESGDNHE